MTKTLVRPNEIRGFANNRLLNQHWRNHANESPQLTSREQYQAKAQNFFKNPPKDTLTGVRDRTWPDNAGDIEQYHPKSNIFGIMSKDGIVRTLYKLNPKSKIHPRVYKPERFNSQKEYFYHEIKSQKLQ